MNMGEANANDAGAIPTLLRCDACGDERTYEIPKGTTSSPWVCAVCGHCTCFPPGLSIGDDDNADWWRVENGDGESDAA